MPTFPSPKEALIIELLSHGRELYGLELVEASRGRLKRGTVYVTLNRMEEKGYVLSRVDADADLPGLPRRLYKPTSLGRRVREAASLIGRRLVPSAAR